MQGSGGLPTKYSFGVCMGQADYRLNIHSVYARVRRIADRIFIGRMQGSGGLQTEYSFGVCKGSGGLLTEYLLGVCRGQADYRLNIHSVYARVRQIADRIFIGHMQGSGGLRTKY